MSTLEKTFKEKLEAMEVGDRIRLDPWDIWRMPTGWVMAIDAGVGVTSVFVPDFVHVEALITNHY